MSYVDGFVAAVPTANKDAYRDHATRAWAFFEEFGAITMWECWGTDVPDGELTSFPKAVKAAAEETVVFAWTVWPDRATRDAGWEKSRNDPRMKAMMDMPFDGRRMIYGGFTPIVQAGRALTPV